jgi:hypothetical protein
MLLPKLLVVSLGVALLLAPPPAFTGLVIDGECARGGHATMRMGDTDAECAKACVISHGSAFVLEAADAVYQLSDQKLAERFAAQKVVVVGTLDEKTRTIKVDSITAAK